MPLTEQQIRLASFLDAHVQPITASGEEEDLALLVARSDDRDSFKQLVDCSTQEEMNFLSERYPGLYRCGKVLERVAEGIASGRIPVPK
jgi:7-keto-8-aminopelargonate synthetase-like enzyme